MKIQPSRYMVMHRNIISTLQTSTKCLYKNDSMKCQRGDRSPGRREACHGASWSTLEHYTSHLKFSLGQRTKHRTGSSAPWGYSHNHLEKRWKRQLWAGDTPQPAHLKQAEVGAKRAISSTAWCCSNRLPNLLQQAENTVLGGSLGGPWKRWQ